MPVGFRSEKDILTPECVQDVIKRKELMNEAPVVVGKAVWKVLGATPAEIQNIDSGVDT